MIATQSALVLGSFSFVSDFALANGVGRHFRRYWFLNIKFINLNEFLIFNK